LGALAAVIGYKIPVLFARKACYFQVFALHGQKESLEELLLQGLFLFLARGSNELLQTGAKRLPYYINGHSHSASLYVY